MASPEPPVRGEVPWSRGGIAGLASDYRSGRASPLGVLDACLQRARAAPPATALATLSATAYGHAEAAQSELGRGDDRGPLHGIPVAVKDTFDVAGEVTRAGSLVTRDRAPADVAAVVVQDLTRAGAVLLGRARTHEFAWGVTTRHATLPSVANPWDPCRVAGGSSGGSAAAVAAGLVPIALGTDTGGSVCIPAAFCGVVGLKPRRHVLSTEGIWPLASTFDTVGLLARTTSDAVTALLALAGGSLHDAAEGTPGHAVLLQDSTWPRLDPAVAEALQRAAAGLAGEGFSVTRSSSSVAAAMFRAFIRVQAVEALQVHRDRFRLWPAHRPDYGPDVASRLERAETVTPSQAATARRQIAPLVAAFERSVGEADVVLLPVSAVGPPTVDDPDHVERDGIRQPARELVLPFTIPAILADWTALSVPVGRDEHGLPLAVQLLGRPGREAAVYAAV